MHLIVASDHLSSLQRATAMSRIFSIILSFAPGVFCMSAFARSMLWLIAWAQSPPPFFLQPKAVNERAAANTNEMVFMGPPFRVLDRSSTRSGEIYETSRQAQR